MKKLDKLLVTLAFAITVFASNVAASDELPIDDPSRFNHKFAQINGIKMHYVVEGEGPLVVLLHGFPLSWYSWPE